MNQTKRYHMARLDVFFAVVLAFFAALTVLVYSGVTDGAERSFLRMAHNALATPFTDDLAHAASFVGNVPFMVLLGALMSAAMVANGYKWLALQAVTTVAAAAATTTLLKALIARPRPELWPDLARESNWSFPSGHATGSAAAAFVVIALTWNTRYRWWAVAGGLVFTLAVSWSRLYLGVHYPTDLVGGWCVAGLWSYYMWRHFHSRYIAQG